MLRKALLKRLADVGFETGEGTIAPFGQSLPLVTAWATEGSTASLALIIEDTDDVEDAEPWRELLFGLSGLRHELRDGGAPALGTPVAIALLRNDESARRLRGVIEQLSQDYALFSRVELNVVVEGDPNAEVEDAKIDAALAPLLLSCRRALLHGDVIGSDTLSTLADEIRAAVTESVGTLEPRLRASASAAAVRFGDRLANLITNGVADEAFEPTVWTSVRLLDYRAFEDQELQLGTLTIADGRNGTGKSSLVEALELLWAGTSQRKPTDESAQRFDEHLGRGGDHHWSVIGMPGEGEVEGAKTVTNSGEHAPGALSRNVFSQDGSADIASATGSQRYEELLRITGLAIPELLAECEVVNREAKSDLDSTLRKLGIPETKSINARAVDHVAKALRVIAPGRTPSAAEVDALQLRLVEEAKRHGLAFRPFEIGRVSDAAVQQLRDIAEPLASRTQSSGEVVQTARELHENGRRSAVQAEASARSIDALLAAAAVNQQSKGSRPSPRQPPSEADVGLPSNLAAIWLSAGRSLRQSVTELRRFDAPATDTMWRDRLERFIALAKEAVNEVPFDDLERIAQDKRHHPSLVEQPEGPIDVELLVGAGFDPTRVTLLPPVVEGSLNQLGRALRNYAADVSGFAEAVTASPLVLLRGQEERLLESLAAFELARALKKPVAAAQAELLTRLISGPLEPLFVELTMALTRFEWYFRPPKMEVQRGVVGFRGLATDSDKLDVRMLLNAGERAIVTLAWFLALHLLQPQVRRRVLVLDDPFSKLDENNQAALVATLRTFARLIRPSVLLVTTHDRVIADNIERDFSAIDGWPATVGRLRFSRSPDGATVAEGKVEESPIADYRREVSRLGLSDPPLIPARPA